MARGFYQNTIALAATDGTLRALSGISVFVYAPGTLTPASIYQGRTGSTLASNPVTTDATGIVEFYADVGEYDVRFKDTNAVPRIADRTVAWECVSATNDGIPYSKIDTGSGIPMSDLALTVNDLVTLLGGYAAQPGDLKATARSSAPTGWLLCDGSSVSRTTYSALWAAINAGHAGTGGDPAPYGNGDGSTTFGLPDYRGRVLVGVGTATGAVGATSHALGQSSGEEKHALGITELADHVHGVVGNITGTNNGPAYAYVIAERKNLSAVMPGGPSPTTGVSTDPGGGASAVASTTGVAHNNMPPYQVANIVIKT